MNNTQSITEIGKGNKPLFSKSKISESEFDNMVREVTGTNEFKNYLSDDDISCQQVVHSSLNNRFSPLDERVESKGGTITSIAKFDVNDRIILNDITSKENLRTPERKSTQRKNKSNPEFSSKIEDSLFPRFLPLSKNHKPFHTKFLFSYEDHNTISCTNEVDFPEHLCVPDLADEMDYSNSENSQTNSSTKRSLKLQSLNYFPRDLYLPDLQ